MRRAARTTGLAFAAVLGFLFLAYLAVWLTLAYQIRRSSRMLAELRTIKIGSSENSITPIVQQFGGSRWDLQLGNDEDYNYAILINPWSYPFTEATGADRGFARIELFLRPSLRRKLGLRKWFVNAEIAIKQNTVIAVQEEVLVEGRVMWLGSMSRFAEKPLSSAGSPDSPESVDTIDERTLLVFPSALTTSVGGGTGWNIWISPSSPRDEQEMAGTLNLRCLNSFSGCDSVCALMPAAAHFFSEHADLAPKGGGWDARSRTCVAPDAKSFQFEP